MDTMALPRTLAPLALVTLLRQLDAEDPNVKFYLRCAGIALVALIGLLLFVIRRNILRQKGGETVITMKQSELEPPNPMAQLLGDDSSNNAQNETVSMTHIEFDMKKWADEARKLGIQSIVVLGIHYKWGYLVPVVISPTMALFGIATSPLFDLHILGRTPESHPQLKRPWAKPAQPSLGSAFTEARSALMGQDAQKPKKARRASKKDE